MLNLYNLVCMSKTLIKFLSDPNSSKYFSSLLKILSQVFARTNHFRLFTKSDNLENKVHFIIQQFQKQIFVVGLFVEYGPGFIPSYSNIKRKKI